MSRVLLALLLVVVLVLVVGFMRGWFSVASQDSDDQSHYQFTVDKQNVREDERKASEEAKELGDKTRDEARAIGRKIDNAVHSKDSNVPKDPKDARDSKDVSIATITLEKTTIEMQPNSKRTVNVTRSGPDLKALQLGLQASSGSNLMASGGAFKEGETESVITIDAPANAHDGSITIIGYGKNQTLNVSVQSALVPVSHENGGAADTREPK